MAIFPFVHVGNSHVNVIHFFSKIHTAYNFNLVTFSEMCLKAQNSTTHCPVITN